MLGDGARPLLHPPLAVIADRGPEHPEVIDPVMLEEPVVLLGDHGIDHVFGNLVVGDREAVLNEDLADLLAGTVQDNAGRLHLRELFQVKRVGLGRKLRHDPSVDRE